MKLSSNSKLIKPANRIPLLMDNNCEALIKKTLHASHVSKGAVIQALWSGYGEVYRANLTGAAVPSVIVKHINPRQQDGSHPRGWHSDVSVNRKMKSYEVEQTWYEHYAQHCNDHCKVPTCYAIYGDEEQRWIVMEDLDSSGYPNRFSRLRPDQCVRCLAWLAQFHALFLHTKSDDLWPVGTYWHLATRQQEWHACGDAELKDRAEALDTLLNHCRYQTLVHGDAKVANFCFAEENSKLGVAAVDFQYTGGGCGIKDIAYFLGSCLNNHDCHTNASPLLDCYFELLKKACRQRTHPIVGADFLAIEMEWRDLYPVAWADFHRFLAGWSPDHQKINDYARLQTRIALDRVS